MFKFWDNKLALLLHSRVFRLGEPRVHGSAPFGVGYVCSVPCFVVELVAGFGMASFSPCLEMIRGVFLYSSST